MSNPIRNWYVLIAYYLRKIVIQVLKMELATLHSTLRELTKDLDIQRDNKNIARTQQQELKKFIEDSQFQNSNLSEVSPTILFITITETSKPRENN